VLLIEYSNPQGYKNVTVLPCAALTNMHILSWHKPLVNWPNQATLSAHLSLKQRTEAMSSHLLTHLISVACDLARTHSCTIDTSNAR